jgi:hypothetical protein
MLTPLTPLTPYKNKNKIRTLTGTNPKQLFFFLAGAADWQTKKKILAKFKLNKKYLI